jgi:hypothetical protein
VAASVKKAEIDNFCLIEHADVEAKTYVTNNETMMANGYTADADFATPFNATGAKASYVKMGRINLPYANKDEDNVSISNAAPGTQQGFVSVTVSSDPNPGTANSGVLNNSVVGTYVNYIIVKGGVNTVTRLAPAIQYVEFDTNKEIAWNVNTLTPLKGLIVLSDINIKQGTEVNVTEAAYLGADMYVGGEINNGTLGTMPNWNGYYGPTAGNFATKFITY